jgi:O-antigen ligase
LLAYYGLQNLAFIFLILLFSLPWSVEYNFNPTLGTNLPDEPLMILTGGLAMMYLIWKPAEIRPAFRHCLFMFLAIHFIWTGVTTLFSSDEFVSVKFLLAKSWYLAAFVLTPLFLFRNKVMIRHSAIVFAISALIITIVIVIRQYHFNWKFGLINDSVTPFFRNHVNYSAMLVCTVPVWIAIRVMNKKNKTARFVVLLIILFIVAALFFSYSRGAWMALLAGLITYWLIRKKLLLIIFIAGVIAITTSVFWLKTNDRYLRFAHDYKTTIFHTDFREHLAATYKLKDVSTAERFNRWIAGVRMVKDNWLTGYGPNTFYNNYKPYAIPAFKTWVSKNEDHSTVHNYFLLMLIEQGVPGLLFFLILCGAMLFYAQNLYHRVNDLFYKNVAMTTGVILVMIFTVNFLSDLLETDKVGSLFFVCLGMLIATDLNTKEKKYGLSNFSSHI